MNVGYELAAESFGPKELIRQALDTSECQGTGWKVVSELPDAVNFDAATSTLRQEDILGMFACGNFCRRELDQRIRQLQPTS